MDSMQVILERWREIWSRFSFNQKAILAIVLGASMLSLVIFTAWLRSDSMVVLYSNLGPEQATSAMEMVSQQGIKLEMRNGGSTLLVPSQDVDRLRMELAVEGIGGDGLRGWDLFDERAMGETEFGLNVRLKRALEGELARSIGSIDRVSGARVHITMPKDSVFLRERHAPTASVLLSLQGRGVPSREQIEGVQNLVASAIEQMTPDNVSVIDAGSGRVLSGGSSQDSVGMSSSQLRVRKEVEDYLAGKASDMLTDMLGRGRYVVRVNADLDFEQLERSSKTFDPQTVVRSEETKETTGDGAGDSSVATTNYEVPSTVENVLRNGSILNKLSVAVAVDGKYAQADGAGEPVYEARTAEELQQIQRIVSGAIGLDDTRGDTIEVVSTQFDPAVPYEPSILENPWLHELPQMIGKILLFLVAVILVLSLRKSISNILVDASRPVPVATRGAMGAAAVGGATMASGAGSTQEASEIEDWARQSPEEVASLIRSFATQEDQ